VSTNTPPETPGANNYVGNVSWTRGDEFRSILRNQHRDIVGMPAGSITAFAGSAAPTGWLLCDGSEIPRAKYAALFKVLGTAYGTPSTGDVFKVPDLRGRAPIGPNSDSTAANTATRNVGDKGGDTRLQTHTHGVSGNTDPGGAHEHQVSTTINGDWAGIATGYGQGGWAVADNPGYNNNTSHLYAAGVGNHTHPISLTSSDHNQSVGTGQNMPPFIVLNYLIKT
jgi:microcystin-dependent protein